MITRGVSFASRLAVFFAVMFAFTACGGGGGGGSSFVEDGGGGGGSNSSELRITLLDADGNETTTVSPSAPGTLRVKVNGGGSGLLVSASTDRGILFPESGTALTNSNATATFRIEAGADRGAGKITASATVDGVERTGFLDFQIGDTGLQIGYFDEQGTFIENQILVEPASTISAGGNAQFTVALIDADGERVGTGETIRFSSGCISAGQAFISPEFPTTVNGEAITLYTAAGCAGTDQITATVDGAAAQAFADIQVAARSTNSVAFISATPTLIVLRGTGGENRDETSDVIFRVVDGAGAPLQGVTVNFSLTTFVGDLTLSKESTISDGNGEVSVTVQAGDVATIVRVIATVEGEDGVDVSTVSDLLTVTTGLPDQNSISLAIDDVRVVGGAYSADGLTRVVSVSMADKFNNPVVDGTAAVFTTEYGSIESSCFTVDGVCSVIWRSQEPRLPTLTHDDLVVSTSDNQGTNCPLHNDSNAIPCPQDLGYIRGARSTITVTAIGEESFVDRNGNGVMDQDERDLFDNIPEAFTDYNEDGVYTPADPECINNPMGTLRCIAGQEELFTDFNSNEDYDFNNDPAVYNGLLCPLEGDGVWCSRELVNVTAENIIVLGDGPNFRVLVVGPGGVVVPPSGSLNLTTGYTIYVSDPFNNPPPGGSTVDVSGEGVCTIFGTQEDTVPNFREFVQGAYQYPGFSVQADPTEEPAADAVIVTLTTPTVTKIVRYGCDAPLEPPEEGEGGA